MDSQKNKPAPRPIDQPHEEFIEDQPNRQEDRSHSSDSMRRVHDTADDRVSNEGDRDHETDMDDLAEDVDEAEGEE